MWDHQFSEASLGSHCPALKGYSVNRVTSAWSVTLDRTRPCKNHLLVPINLALSFLRTQNLEVCRSGLTLYY